ncbi:MAG: sigma 54-interacting transcriptional regulator [Candidatus Cloacimonetes bacterium]|nr:sigma 54-interacting transcriptional regulator [Candidatus Cloacimonadota bacterium]
MDGSKSIRQLENELDSIRKKGNKEELIPVLEALVGTYSHTEDVLQSIPYVEELILLFTQAGNKLKTANCYDFLSRVYSFKPDYAKTEESARKSLELYEELGNLEGQSFCYVSLGGAYRNQGRIDEALELLFQAKDLMQKQIKIEKQPKKILLRGYIGVHEQIGILYGILKQQEKSREYTRLALKMAKEQNDVNSIFKALINLGVSYNEEDTEKTLEYYLEALPYVEESGLTHILAIVKNNIGGVYEDREELDQALEYYQEALELIRESEINKNRTFYLKHIGTVYFKQQNFREALKYLKTSLKDALKMNLVQEVEEIYHLLSKVYKAQQNFEKSLMNFEKYSELKDKRLNSEVIEKISNLQKKYEDAKKQLVNTQRKSSLISEVLKKQMSMNLIGRSNAIKEVHELAMKAAQHQDTNVLITGESGTGKEIIAHIIHFASNRKDSMIIPVNCSSIPETLMESEFFGHKKGSFTGALADKTGYLEEADKGTLFLDEIGDMPASLQAKLLRVLESKKIKPIGSSKEMQIDFRLIAATNKDINQLIEDNIFRVDLFYRINTIEIYIPPLRERKSDIEPLVHFFISEYAQALKKPLPKIALDVMEQLENYSFPGNVRELRNMVERAMIMLRTDTLSAECFNLRSAPVLSTQTTGMDITTLEEMEREMILGTLDRTGNNHSKTARILGISYSTLNRKLKQMNQG